VYDSFRPTTATSKWLLVKCRHFRVTSGHLRSRESFPVTWLPPMANYILVGCKVYSICQFLALYSHLQVVVKWHHFWVTSGHIRSRHVISCHVTASSCELQPCGKWNPPYLPVFGILQLLPGHFRSNDITSGSLPVTGGHVISFPVTWLPPPVSYSLVGSEIYSVSLFSALYRHFQVTSGKWRHLRVTSGYLKSRDIISCHVTASSCELQPCRKWSVQYMPVFGPLEPLPGDFRSNVFTSGSLPVTWGRVTSFSVTWLNPPASYSLVGSQMCCIYQFSALYSHFQVTSRQMTSLAGHFQ